MFMDFDEILHFLSSITLIRSMNWNPAFLRHSQLVAIVFPFLAIVFVLALLITIAGSPRRLYGYFAVGIYHTTH